jgi:hypothetical protein
MAGPETIFLSLGMTTNISLPFPSISGEFRRLGSFEKKSKTVVKKEMKRYRFHFFSSIQTHLVSLHG